MMNKKTIAGFSKLSKTDKIKWLAQNFLYNNPVEVVEQFADYWHESVEQQKVFDGFSENTLTNFYLPFGIAPNFLINGDIYAVPMVTEESSVVAACSNAAKFWLDKGGFKAKVLSTVKVGQVHFLFRGDGQKLKAFFPELREDLLMGVKHLTANMEKRGGGVLDVELLDFTHELEGLYQLRARFETCDSMGANFINSVLEEFGAILTDEVSANKSFSDSGNEIQVVMCILSNFTPECVVNCKVSCLVEDLGEVGGLPAEEFAQKFVTAVRIAQIDPYRATTHNKGIMNGIDSLVIATGNDFRAVEACAHTYAARNGRYESLTEARIENGKFIFEITVPLALGTVGGLTNLHPLAKKSIEMLGNPPASRLMEICAAVGLSQNFAAVRALVTSGIQHGHMKMHLNNIILSLQANEEEGNKIRQYFDDKVVSVSAVREYLLSLRNRINLA